MRLEYRKFYGHANTLGIHKKYARDNHLPYMEMRFGWVFAQGLFKDVRR